MFTPPPPHPSSIDTEAVRQAHPLVDFLTARGVSLKPSGKVLTGRCPIHHEQHGAAFTVYPDQARWHCFGKCQTGGDVISLLMHLENCDFVEACRRLGSGPSAAEKASHGAAGSGNGTPMTHSTHESPKSPPPGPPTPETAHPESPPPTLTHEQGNLRFTTADHLYYDRDLCARIARKRGWQPQTIHDLAAERSLGWDPTTEALVFLYSHGIKVRRRAPDGSRHIRWLFGGNHELWRGDLLNVRQAASLCSSQKDHRQAARATFPDTRTIWLCEGETDAISLLDHGFEKDETALVLALPCASAWNPTWAAQLTDREIVLVLDRDLAGQRAAARLTQELQSVAAKICQLDFAQLAPRAA